MQNPSEKLKFRGCVYRLEIAAGEPTALGLRQAAPRPAPAQRTPTHTVKGLETLPPPPMRLAARPLLPAPSGSCRPCHWPRGSAAPRGWLRRCYEPAALWAGRPAVRREVREGPGRRCRRRFRVRGEAAAEDDGVSA